MKAYFGSRISPNITRTEEGYLVCHNVPIARTGWYEYLPNEIGASGDQVVHVYRPEEEVFDPAAMASFEGKPFTNNHPSEGVAPSNFSQYAKGHATNIRRGKGDDDDLLLADIVANDEQTIQDIVNGKREISAGYECDYEPNDDGTFTQRNIRGNHVALVDAGRAGDRVRINDSSGVRYPAEVSHDQLMAMVDLRTHNHHSPSDMKRVLDEGGERYVLSKVNPNDVYVKNGRFLRTRDSFDQSKAKPIIVSVHGSVIDGRHRVMSARKAGVDSIDAYIPKQPPRKGVNETQDRTFNYREMTDAEKSQYLNPDGTFKGGFEGAVKYFMSKGYSKEAANKIAGKIAAQKAGDESPDEETSLAHWMKNADKMKARDSHMSIKLPSRKKSRVTDLLAAVGLKHFAIDAEPDEIVDAVDAMAEERQEAAVPAEPEKKEDSKDDVPATAGDNELEKKVDRLTALVEKLLAGKSEDEDPEKKIDDAIAQMENPEGDDEESQTIEANDDEAPVSDPEDRPQSGFKAADSAAAVAYLKAMKPVIAKLKDPAEKKMMVDAALKAIKGTPSKPSAVYQQMQKPQKKAQDGSKSDPSELGRQWMKQNNPHYKNRA